MTTLADRLKGLAVATEDLIERHEGQSRRSFDVYRGEAGKLRFYREVLGYEPYQSQEAVAVAVEGHKRVVVRGAHGVGKERVAASEALYGCLVKGQLVLLLSATERQVLGQTMKEVRRLFSGNATLPGDLYTATLRIKGESRILAFAGSSIDSLTGWHDPNGVLVIISEGQGERLEDVAYDAALMNATDDLSRVLILGNPVRPVGRFYEASRSPNWHAIRIAVTDHPNIQQGRMVIPGGPSPSWPEEMAAEYGTDSPMYQARVLAEFPSTAEESLVQRVWLERAAERWEAWRDWREDETDPAPGIGVDVARLGMDRTVMAVRRGNVLEELKRIERGDTMETAARLAREFARVRLGKAYVGRSAYRPVLWFPGRDPSPGTHPVVPIVDEAGVGGGVVDRLREDGLEVVGFNSSFSPIGKDADRYLNLRAQAYWRLRHGLEHDEFAIPYHAELWEELMATSWWLNSSGKVQIEEKKTIKAVLKRSPDYADAVAMAFFESPPKASVRFFSVKL